MEFVLDCDKCPLEGEDVTCEYADVIKAEVKSLHKTVLDSGFFKEPNFVIRFKCKAKVKAKREFERGIK